MCERNQMIDILRGILIVFVVAGHFNRDFGHDIIFLFHMPLFFILSGLLLNKTKLINRNGYFLSKFKSLFLPYVIYLLGDFVFIQRQWSLKNLGRVIWGGRAITGVYWYITCYLFTLFLFSVLLRKFSDRVVKSLILIGGVTAIIESHLVGEIHLLQSPGIPWNLDVSLIALVYVGIGFFYKDKIKELLESNLIKYDLVSGIVTIALILFCCFIYKEGNEFYYFDMKPVYYKELISAILIPCSFGFVLIRLVHWLVKVKRLNLVNHFLVLCGRVTIPIMFMHIPLNHWKDSLGYGRIMFLIIGIGIPLGFTLIFNKCELMRKLFGLPKL